MRIPPMFRKLALSSCNRETRMSIKAVWLIIFANMPVYKWLVYLGHAGDHRRSRQLSGPNVSRKWADRADLCTEPLKPGFRIGVSPILARQAHEVMESHHLMKGPVPSCLKYPLNLLNYGGCKPNSIDSMICVYTQNMFDTIICHSMRRGRRANCHFFTATSHSIQGNKACLNVFDGKTGKPYDDLT